MPGDGELHGEGGLYAGCAGQLYDTAVRLDGAAHDAEAEAGAFDLWGVMFVAAEEALEDEGQIMRGDADAVVSDLEHAMTVTPAALHTDVEAGVGVLFQRVFDEVGEDLIPVKAVATHGAAVGWEIELDGCLCPAFDHWSEVV